MRNAQKINDLTEQNSENTRHEQRQKKVVRAERITRDYLDNNSNKLNISIEKGKTTVEKEQASGDID